MSDAQSFSDHVNKLMFIKRIQEREGLLDRFMSGNGIMARGGGIGRGDGLPIGGGLDSSGFKSRRPAVQEQMLSGSIMKETLDEFEGILNELDPDNFTPVDSEESKTPDKFEIKPGIKLVRIEGETNKRIFTKNELEYERTSFGKIINDNNKELAKSHDAKNFTGTKSKAIIFKHDDGRISKFKSIGDLSKHTGFSKYKILGSFKPKKSGDSFHHKKLKGTLTFVDKNQYNTYAAISSYTPTPTTEPSSTSSSSTSSSS